MRTTCENRLMLLFDVRSRQTCHNVLLFRDNFVDEMNAEMMRCMLGEEARHAVGGPAPRALLCPATTAATNSPCGRRSPVVAQRLQCVAEEHRRAQATSGRACPLEATNYAQNNGKFSRFAHLFSGGAAGLTSCSTQSTRTSYFVRAALASCSCTCRTPVPPPKKKSVRGTFLLAPACHDVCCGERLPFCAAGGAQGV